MDRNLDVFIQALADAQTSDQLKRVFSKEIKTLGYDGFDASSYSFYPDKPAGNVPNFLVASYAPSFLETYLNDGHVDTCPVMLEIMQATVPFDYVALLERTEQNTSVLWQRKMLRCQRVAAAWCIPMNAVGAMRAVTVYMRDKGIRTPQIFAASREDVATRARFFMQALLAFRVGKGMTDRKMEVSLDVLSVREKDCLRFLIEGQTNPEIAERMRVSRNTVQFHLKNIYRKLNVTNRTEAVRFATTWGLVSYA